MFHVNLQLKTNLDLDVNGTYEACHGMRRGTGRDSSQRKLKTTRDRWTETEDAPRNVSVSDRKVCVSSRLAVPGGVKDGLVTPSGRAARRVQGIRWCL